MIREMTLGQYYKADSVLHKLDARVKLLGTLLFVITLFFPKSLLSLGIATVFLVFTIKLSKVPFSMMIRGVKPLFVIICFSAIINMISVGGEVLIKLGPVSITKQGLWMAFYLVVRLVYLVIGSSVMTFTTTPNQLTDGLEKGFQFLKKVHIPVHEIAMMMSLALRFVPTLLEETDKITQAQKARGADMESGNIIQRVKAFIPILIPLFVSAFRRAYELATAMECRCYRGGTGRTRMKTIHMAKRDYVSFVMVALLIGGVILCNIFLPAAV
mgnify:CR=1 FL=1